ncbi:DUF2939 domain-containing protein [Thermus amyloliquefaciens]|uniref:DUF2939 domain-containing protein n=1 Tax=Thermus amyloliquefaciens TaxID=1449080 RepID=UPI0005715858|nr:DUF2939 domain-containing protein [Thermus amyloliquefaciens]
MKARWWLAVLLPLVLGGYLVLSPYFALRGLQVAIERRDAAALERYVDFPRVREALKADLHAAMVKELERNQENPFAALGVLLAGGLIQAVVDSLLTPEGLASVGTGKDPGEVGLEEVRRWRLKWQGLSRVFVHHRNDPQTGLLMERQGLGWRVVRLVLNP